MSERLTDERLDTYAATAQFDAQFRRAHPEAFRRYGPRDDEQLLAVIAECKARGAERDKLQAFKSWCHGFLDTHGVPHHPPGPHGAEGCRIGDRMDWLMAERDALRKACEAAADYLRVSPAFLPQEQRAQTIARLRAALAPAKGSD